MTITLYQQGYYVLKFKFAKFVDVIGFYRNIIRLKMPISMMPSLLESLLLAVNDIWVKSIK